MRVLHVEAGRHLYGGARQVVYLVRELARRGVDSVLVCPPSAAIATELAMDCKVVEVPLGGDLDLGFVLRLRRVIRDQKPDLIHLHSRRGADTLGALAAKLAGVPCVLSRRVDNPESRWLVPLKYSLYHRVIAISEGIAEVLRRCGVPASQITCVRSAIDHREFALPADPAWFRDTFQLPDNAITIGVVAQLIPRKGHRYLLAVLPGLLEQYPSLQVLFFGQGPLHDDLQAAAATLGGRVKLAGFRSDLPRVLPNLDVLVHPAEREGLGVSLIQAAAAGVPIVASRAGGMPEIVHDGVNGYLVPPGDTDALAIAINKLLSDPDAALEMGARGRARVRDEFSVPVMAMGNLEVYRQVLSNH